MAEEMRELLEASDEGEDEEDDMPSLLNHSSSSSELSHTEEEEESEGEDEPYIEEEEDEPSLSQLVAAVQDAQAEYELASARCFRAGERVAALETEFEHRGRHSGRVRTSSRVLVIAARQRWEAATREEKDYGQRRRDCELLLAQRRYTRPEEGETPVNEPQLQHIRDCIRALLDQTLDGHLRRQRDEGRPAPLPQMWLDATRSVQRWFPDQPRAMVSASLHWNRSWSQSDEGRADNGDARTPLAERHAHEEEPSVEGREELVELHDDENPDWQRAAREFMEEFGEGDYAYGDREETEDMVAVRGQLPTRLTLFHSVGGIMEEGFGGEGGGGLGAEGSKTPARAWQEYIAERKNRLTTEMEALEDRMEAVEISEYEYLKGMNRLQKRYNHIGRRWRTLGA